MNAQKVGKAIAFLRKKMNMTQKQLADEIMVSYQAVSKWENGLSVPDISVIAKIAKLLDTDVETLLEGNITQHDNDWIGVLYLNYPDGLKADSMLYTQPLVEFQAALFMLAGIKNIYLIGDEKDLNSTKNILENKHLGAHFLFIDKSGTPAKFLNTSLTDHGAIVISSPSFIYGKDITRTMQRIMNDEKTPVILRNSDGDFLNMCFVPEKVKYSDITDNIDVRGYKTSNLERGIIAFPIDNVTDLLDASLLVRIIETHQKEKVLVSEDVARNRNLI